MMGPMRLTALCLLCIVVAVVPACVASQFRESTPLGFYAHEARVKQELRNLGDHPWAGDYSWPPGMQGLTLRLAPTAGWTSHRWACMYQTKDYGGILTRGNRIVFTDRHGKDLAPDQVGEEILGPLRLALDLHRVHKTYGSSDADNQLIARLERVLPMLETRTSPD